MANPPEESDIVFQLQQGSEQAFRAVFDQHHVGLYRLALTYVRIPQTAEDVVHDVLLYLWERRQEISITTSLKAYLYAAVKHRALDYLKSQYARQVYESDMPETLPAPGQADSALELQQVKQAIGEAIARLPEKCRLIYTLSRNTGLTYQEIAEQLDLSPKTVETQMGIALQRLRKYLEHYWLAGVGLPLLFQMGRWA